MIKSLKINWYIWSKSRLVIASFILLTLLLIILPVSILLLNNKVARLKPFAEQAFSYPLVFNTLSIIGLFVAQIVPVFIILFNNKNIESHTYKFLLLNGSNRISLYMQNIYIILLFILYSFFVKNLVGLIFSLDYFVHYKTFQSSVIIEMFIFPFQLFVYSNLALSFSFLFKRSGVAMLIYIIWFGLIERFIAQIINFNAPFKLYPYGNLLPGKSIEELNSLAVVEIFGSYIQIKPDFSIFLLSTLFWLFISTVYNIRAFRTINY